MAGSVTAAAASPRMEASKQPLGEAEMVRSKAAQDFLRETSLLARELRVSIKERDAVIGAATVALLRAGDPVTIKTLLSFLPDAMADVPPEDASRAAGEDAQQLLRKLAAPEGRQPNQGPA